MSARSDPAEETEFGDLARQLAAAGWRLDNLGEGPVRGAPIFASFVHADGRRLRYAHDLLTGATVLDGEATPAPEVDAFGASPVEIRRQVLRWWMRDRAEMNGRIAAVLRAALVDPDVETRVTAVLAALRLRAWGLAEAVRRADIPETTASGAFPGDRRLYAAIRALAARALTGRAWPEVDRLFRVLDDDRIERPEALLLRALCEPCPVVEPLAILPPGVIVADGRLRLRDLGIDMCWVPDLPHWRGGLRPTDQDDPRLRRETPPPGLFVARAPLSPWQLDRLGVADSADGLVGAEDAERAARQASAEVGATMTLVDLATWSLALHGPDGRLLPWGNTLTPSQASGPWEVEWATVAEWVRGADGLSPRQVARRGVAEGDRAAVRLMLKA